MFKRVSILGAGSWGMAIARLLEHNGLKVTLWEFNAEDCQIISQQRCHPKKLPNVKLADSIKVTNDIYEAILDTELIILSIPSQSLRSALKEIPSKTVKNIPMINLAKGIEIKSLKRMSEVITEELNHPLELTMTLSGPSHAEEVASDIPTAVVLAGTDSSLTESIQRIFSNNSFRVYQSTDLVGVELGGSLKNIIAIAAGITAGLKMGDNTMGALITRGLAEISRLGIAMGAQPETFAGLSGIGDLITTCMSQHSRNRYVGEHIGRGQKLDDVLAGMAMVAEGVETTRSGFALSQQFNVEMPITNEVYEVLFNNKPPDIAVGELMDRKLKTEIW